jgi:periplasmic copper chaperone A
VIRRPLFIVATTALLVLALAAPAFAHVTARADNPTPGSFTKITFRVPNEEDAADTTELSVQLPPEHPIASVSVKPKEGWTFTVTKAPLNPPVQTDDGELTEAVSTITWTGGAIKPGEFDEFEISGGPLPTDTESLTFKAVQTYSDGTVVRWIDEATEGGAEPEHPAPTIQLAAAGDAAATDSHGAAEGDDAAATGSAASSGESDDNDTGKTLGIIGIILGGLGLIAGVAALGLRSQPPPADGGPTDGGPADPGPADRGAADRGAAHGGPAH